MSTRYVQIEKDGVEGQCMPAAVKAWEKHGWTVVDDGSSESAPEAPVGDEAAPAVEAVTPQTPSGRTKTKE
jgi:hypothetical protein